MTLSKRLVLLAFIAAVTAFFCGAIFHNPRLDIVQKYELSGITVACAGIVWLVIEWIVEEFF